jgi:hypothetical protein
MKFGRRDGLDEAVILSYSASLGGLYFGWGLMVKLVLLTGLMHPGVRGCVAGDRLGGLA